MEGHNNNNGYLQEEVNYDDILSGSTGWPPPTDQYAYQRPDQAQASYVPPYSTHPSFDHFDMHEHSYPTAAYTNSPYTAQSQYQHAKPSDVFGPTSYNLDPALQSSNGYPVDSSFSFGHSGDSNTISPQNLQQYQMASAQPPVYPGTLNNAFQGSASDYNRQPQDLVYFNNTQNGSLQSLNNSVRYPALPSGSSVSESSLQPKKSGATNDTLKAAAPPQLLPKSLHNVLRITHPELHAADNPSSRPRFQYAPFLSWEDTPIQVAPGLKSTYPTYSEFFFFFFFLEKGLQLTDFSTDTLPKYHPRKSKSGKALVPGLDIFRKFCICLFDDLSVTLFVFVPIADIFLRRYLSSGTRICEETQIQNS